MAKHLPSPGRSAGFSVLLLGFACLGAAAASGQTQKTEDSVDAKGAVEPAAVEEEITVYAEASQVHLTPSYAGGQVARGGRAGLLGNLDFLEAPFSGTAYTQALAETQQADSVGDVLRNDPGVRVTNGFGNFQEVYILRGFPVFSDDITLNGLFGILPRQFVAAELLERVEVFRGANAFINGAAPGASGSGGTVNLVQKRAPEGGVQKVSLGFENEGQLYAAVDVGRRFGADGAWGVRWNAALRDGETSVADQERELTVISLGTDYDGEGFRFSADVGYQDNRLENPRPQVTPFGAAPEVPDPDGNYAQPGTFTDEEQLFGVVRAELDVSDAVTLWVAGGGRSGEEANVLANPTAAPDGSTTAFRFDNTREDSIVSADVGGRAEFTTGSVGHRLVISASVIDTDSKNAFALSSFFAPFASDLFDPTPLPALPAADFFTGGDLDDPMTTEAVKNTSFAVADTLSLVDDRLLVTVGLRLQTLEARSFDFNTGVELSSYD
ncbi:MAG: TonB-dependent receptor plug domain-containing protein, partial [Acidobacteriota bacterium]